MTEFSTFSSSKLEWDKGVYHHRFFVYLVHVQALRENESEKVKWHIVVAIVTGCICCPSTYRAQL